MVTTLELRFSGCDYGLSGRRLWEHTELGQINVFGRAISQKAYKVREGRKRCVFGKPKNTNSRPLLAHFEKH